MVATSNLVAGKDENGIPKLVKLVDSGSTDDSGNVIWVPSVDATVEVGDLGSVKLLDKDGVNEAVISSGGALSVTGTQLPATLGQKAMAASMAVVIASDQATFPVASTAAATEVHLGQVGGEKTAVTVEFTRPANSTAYAALDVIGVDLAVTGATNASPIVVTTATHSLADGDPITITGVLGNTAANANAFAKVTGFSSTTFGLYSDKALTTPIAGNGAYTSGGDVARLFRLPNFARVEAGSGYVVKGQILTDQKTCVARVKVHLFTSPVTAYLDNVPYLKLYANRTMRTGEIIFPAMATEDPSNSTAAGSLVDPNTFNSNVPLSFGCAASDRDLYFMVETLDVFTPASGQNFFLKFTPEQD